MRKRCPVCRRDFEGRRDKKTCSDRCKKRLQRAVPISERMVEDFTEAQYAIRFLWACMDGEHKARAQRMITTLIREAAGYLPDYERWALAGEFRESVDVSKVGQQYVPTAPTL